jgi:hypothetical protein
MGGFHFTYVHNLRVSTSAVLLTFLANYQGASFVAPHGQRGLTMKAGSLSIC